MRARQAQRFAQQPDQQRAALDLGGHGPAVDGERNLWHRERQPPMALSAASIRSLGALMILSRNLSTSAPGVGSSSAPRFSAAAMNSGSCTTLSKASRSTASRSAGTPGGTIS